MWLLEKFLNSFAVCSRFLLDSAAFNPSCLGPYGKLVPRIWAQGHSVLDYSKLDTSLLADAITSLRGDLVGTFYSFSRKFNLLGCKNVIQKESDLKNPSFLLPLPPLPSLPLPPFLLCLLILSLSLSLLHIYLILLTYQLASLSLTPWEEKYGVWLLPSYAAYMFPSRGKRDREIASVSEVSLLTPQEGAGRPDHGHVTPCANQLPEHVSPCLFLLKRLGDETSGQPQRGARAGQPASKKACKPGAS